MKTGTGTWLLLALAGVLLAGPAPARGAGAKPKRPPKVRTLVRDQPALDRLMGKHLLSLQWISWKRFGVAEVKDDQGLLILTGEQRDKKSGDYLRLQGTIFFVDKRSFRFSGTIVTRVSHINGGKPCTREGTFTFRITGKRKYWRLKQMDNPCDEATDYVDIYFARPQ